ncbi:MAG TPA: UvrD-helicase domain-containing protein [Spirochaetota bacterium]|nr:UvrD-helicase domain-containing protein [Spirochaetota bacterium]HPI88840.1 UvrD-helicase domain-containing protein [Spirochaetota bacterium]HPR47672.1 UvrD-helicase domain-containing protein [Spirochaetota bacterium]
MKFIADFHIHSHFSIATSKNLVPEHLEYWARLKGINVIGTGDCVHPGWLAELKEKLEPAGNGFYRLKNEYRLEQSRRLTGENIPDKVFFQLTGEISSIYKKDGRVRKVHNVIVCPDFDSVEKIQRRLEKVGNIRSDGRPILGLDSKYLLEMVLESHELSELIPAHIWTPWFSVLGSMSGFDSLDECYEDLTRHIHAVETGLSSDPPMNWACSFLDRFKLVSNSDAHSPEKLGREANLFDTELSYEGVMGSLRGGSGFLGTIEFFPQEGKYHYDGHRKCGIRWTPLETARHGGICPVCGRAVTRGVLYRVAQLADRSDPEAMPDRKEFHSITQLPDLLAEVLGQKSSTSKSVRSLYNRIIEDVGAEFYVLLFADLAAVEEAAGDMVAEGIGRLRQGSVMIEEGYDGEFGRVKVFAENERGAAGGLFSAGARPAPAALQHASVDFDVAEFRKLLREGNPAEPAMQSGASALNEKGDDYRAETDGQELNPAQEKAVACPGPCMVLAGPGTGKTRILTERIGHLMKHGARPENILAVTFSNKAAEEIRSRIACADGEGSPEVMTFHALGLSVLKEYFDRAGREVDFYLVDDDERREILSSLVPAREAAQAMRLVESVKEGRAPEAEGGALLTSYNNELKKRNAFDLADLIYEPVALFKKHDDILSRYREKYRHVLVDEFQDINARQYEMLALLCRGNEAGLFVIGDPDQAIYGFRGSDPRFIESAARDFPGITDIELSRSYRCPGQVLRAGGQVLQRDGLLEGASHEMKINIIETETERSEADWIAATIESLLGGTRSFSRDSGITDGVSSEHNLGLSDIAVLCRSSFMFGPLREAMANHGIPCQITETTPFYHREPVAGLIKKFKSLYVHSGGEETGGADRQALEMMEAYRPVIDVVRVLVPVHGVDETDAARIFSIAEKFGDNYEDFFRALALRRGVDDYDDRAEAVSIMTLHASKGLEFGAVFIPGCEEGVIPLDLFGEKGDEHRREEERLLYVGMTRTMSLLYLTHAKKRAYRGRVLVQKRSPFVDRIEKELVEKGKREALARKEDDGQMKMF